MFLSLMSLQPFSIIKKEITFYLNMFLTLLPYKTFFKKNLSLTSLILNNFAVLKITLIIGSPPIFFKFIIFNINFFQNLTLNTKTKEQIQIYSLFLRKFFRHNYQLVWHSKFQTAFKNFPQQFTPDELLPFLDISDNHHPHYYNLLEFPSSHFAYLTYDSNSIDKSLNLPPPVHPYSQQYNIPLSNDTIPNFSLQTLPSSSHVAVNPTSSLNQHLPPSTSQVTSLPQHNPPPNPLPQSTTITDNHPPSHSPSQYTAPSNTPPAVICNSVQPSTFQIPTLNPIPLSLHTTIPTQFLSQNPPSSSTQYPSISQTTSSTTQSTSYNHYVSLYPTFQNFPTTSFQPPPNPSHSIPFNSSSSYPSFPFPTTPSVPFAALSDPIKLFDGFDHTYPPEKFLAHLSARVTFQLGPQPVDIQSCLTWHSRRMSLLYCSLTGTASNWYDRLPQVYKDDWSSFLQIFKKQFYSQKHAYHVQIEALSLVKKDNENVRHFALKVETLVKQGWYNEYPSMINLKCNEIFTRGLPRKLKDFANKRQVKHISSSLEPSIPFHALVNMVDSEDITLEKFKTQELSLEINNLSNSFQQNTNIQLSSSEPPQVQVIDPNKKSKPQFKKYCSFCHKNNHSISTCFRRLNMLKESKPQSRSPTPTFYHHFKNPSNKTSYPRYRSRSYSNPSRRSSRDTRYQSRSFSRSHSRPRYNTKTSSRTYSPYHNRDRSRYDKHYNHNPHKSNSSSRSYYHSNPSRSPSKYYPRSRERSSNSNTSTFHRYNSPYRPPSKPRNDRYRSRSRSNSHNRPQFQYKPSVNLTNPSTPPSQLNSQTESIFELNMYHPNISSTPSYTTSTEHANAITPST